MLSPWNVPRGCLLGSHVTLIHASHPLAKNSNGLYEAENRMLARLKSAERGQGAMPKNWKALRPKFPITRDTELLTL